MKYKYNIKHKVGNKVKTINFKTKASMIKFLDDNTDKINNMTSPVLHFGPVMLPLKQTSWYVKQPTLRSQKKEQEQAKLKKFISGLEKNSRT